MHFYFNDKTEYSKLQNYQDHLPATTLIEVINYWQFYYLAHSIIQLCIDVLHPIMQLSNKTIFFDYLIFCTLSV